MFVPRDVNFNRRDTPVFDPVEVLGRHGYWCTPDYNDIRVYAPSATRKTIKEGCKPIAMLSYQHVKQIQQHAQSDDDVLMMVASIAETGTIPDPLQLRVEQLANAKTAELQDRLTKAEALLAEIGAERAALAAEKAGVELGKQPAVAPPIPSLAGPQPPAPEPAPARPVALKKQKGASASAPAAPPAG